VDDEAREPKIATAGSIQALLCVPDPHANPALLAGTLRTSNGLLMLLGS
jgi:hypothetical protein